MKAIKFSTRRIGANELTCKLNKNENKTKIQTKTTQTVIIPHHQILSLEFVVFYGLNLLFFFVILRFSATFSLSSVSM